MGNYRRRRRGHNVPPPSSLSDSLEALRNELRAQRANPFSKRRSKILHRYGMKASGRLRFCSVGRDSANMASRGKVMYATWELAERARAELEALDQVRPMRVYPCSDAIIEHYHLASVKQSGST